MDLGVYTPLVVDLALRRDAQPGLSGKRGMYAYINAAEGS